MIDTYILSSQAKIDFLLLFKFHAIGEIPYKGYRVEGLCSFTMRYLDKKDTIDNLQYSDNFIKANFPYLYTKRDKRRCFWFDNMESRLKAIDEQIKTIK